MSREDERAELEQWRREARANDGQRTGAPVGLNDAITKGAEPEPTRDVPCRHCRKPVAMTATGAWFGKQAAMMAAQLGFKPLMVHEIMRCADCERSFEHRLAADFELFRQEFVERVRRSKENESISDADRAWFLANDCKSTVEGLEERFARAGEKRGPTTTRKRRTAATDDGAGFGRRA